MTPSQGPRDDARHDSGFRARDLGPIATPVVFPQGALDAYSVSSAVAAYAREIGGRYVPVEGGGHAAYLLPEMAGLLAAHLRPLAG